LRGDPASWEKLSVTGGRKISVAKKRNRKPSEEGIINTIRRGGRKEGSEQGGREKKGIGEKKKPSISTIGGRGEA